MDGDFELEICAGSMQNEYTVRVICAPAGGEPSARFHLEVDQVLNRRADLENLILASAVPARRTVPVAEKPLHEVGQHLFKMLFPGPVNNAYRASLGAAQHSGRPLRVVLRLAAPELAALPWEMLFDPETETYLCRTRPLLRRIPAADYKAAPLEVTPPLRILGIVSAPSDLGKLNADLEKRHLADALAEPIATGHIELVWAPRATWEDVQTQLLTGAWHVVHFVGHGDYDTCGNEGRLALVGADGRADMIESSRLTDLFGEADPTPRLVVLNSCSSGQAGEDDLFSGTAAALVRGGINSVAAMQFTVSDNAAIAFARGFYTAIAAGRDIDKAAGSGRTSILGHGSLEWVTPVLYVRGGSTRLFKLTGTPAPHEMLVPVPPERRPAQLRAMYFEARGEFRMQHYEMAVELFDDLLTLAPEYRDAAALRDTAQQCREVADTYHAARKAEDAGDWETAARGYAEVQSDPAFPDADTRLQQCQRKQKITDLQEELRYYADAENWQTVVDVDTELASLDPAAADPDGLTTHARSRLLDTQVRRAEDDGDHKDDCQFVEDSAADRQPDPQEVVLNETVVPNRAKIRWWRRTPTHWITAALAVVLAAVAAIGVVVTEEQPPTTPAPTTLPFTGLNNPRGVAVNTDNGDVYITDYGNNRVLKLGAGSSAQTELPFTGLNGPAGVAVNTDNGDVYITDYGNNRVLKLGAGSSAQTELPFTGLNGPAGVAVNTDNGDVYITDYGNNRVLKLGAGSSAQTELPFTGLNGPAGVAVNTVGNVFVADYGNNRVLKLAVGSSFATVMPFTSLYGPVGVALSADEDVYVANNSQVLKLVVRSSFVDTLPFSGLDGLAGVAVNRTTRDVYVTDSSTDRVLELAADG